ncbi:MAG: CAP domain-containing protein [Candidatus Kariarchaeaceae archaeon]|jgi:hypothetical protein
MRATILLFILLLAVPVQADVPTELEVKVHELINEVRLDRTSHGQELQALRLHSVLIDVARAHSEDMLQRQYFAHVSPDGDDVADRVEEAGVDYTAVGENLFWMEAGPGADVASEAVDGWVNSPGHYANILTSYAFTGIGVATDGSQYYITQVFYSGDPAHLRDIGQIYDNDDLDAIVEERPRFRLTAEMGAAIVIVLVIVIGIDANRRNNRYYGRR